MPDAVITRPSFITLTGADDNTEPKACVELFERYRDTLEIEFGILISDDTKNRYPSPRWIERFLDSCERYSIPVSMHACKSFAQFFAGAGSDSGLRVLRDGAYRMLLEHPSVRRIQINLESKHVTYDTMQAALRRVAQIGLTKRAIFQWRDPLRWPVHDEVDWLYDCSGGRGILSNLWPPYPENLITCGYAGGLTPHNVCDALDRVRIPSKARYWLDAETGLRGSDDLFSLDRCNAFAQAIVDCTE